VIRSLKNATGLFVSLCCIAGALCALPTAAAAASDTLSPAEVVEIDRDLNGTVIEFEGEAIGEALHADATHKWVNVLGDGMAVGVYVASDSADLVGTFGDHRHDGDIVRVSGTINVACDEHAGEFDVHAERFEIISQGEVRETPIQPWKAVVGLLGVAVFLVEWRFYGRLKERNLA